MWCKNCGHAVRSSDKHCVYCGKPLPGFLKRIPTWGKWMAVLALLAIAGVTAFSLMNTSANSTPVPTPTITPPPTVRPTPTPTLTPTPKPTATPTTTPLGSWSDDFESYGTGAFPSSGGWVLVYSGSGSSNQYVDNSHSVSGTKSLHLVGSSCWSANAYHAVDLPLQVSFEARVFIDAIVNCGCTNGLAIIGLCDRNLGTWGSYYGSVSFDCDGKIHAVTTTSDGQHVVELGSYQPRQWYHVQVDIDLVSRLFDVYINGTLCGSGLQAIYEGTPKGIEVVSGHGGNPTAWFDDVKVTNTFANSTLNPTPITTPVLPTPSPTPLPLADLIPHDISWSSGQSLIFSFEVTNQSVSGWAKSFSIRCSVDGSNIVDIPMSPMYPGQTVRVQYDWGARSGSHKFNVVVDYNNSVPESDEKNNEIGVPFSLQ